MNIFQKTRGLLAAALTMLSGVGAHIKPAVKVVNLIKEAVDNPAFDLVVNITATPWDNITLQKLRAALYAAIKLLSDVGHHQSGPEALAHLVKSLRDAPAPLQSAMYSKLASTVATKLSGGVLTEVEADTLVQLHYAQTKLTA
ncbi:hypothetical protein GCM10023185_13320 [Hymenobacter saemangeumensis]|uniref:TerB family tellurite resistance protein n=1 Tax=Hymenobacter saemangeumensis TaxID=1084522 RepID=A0ABP8I865_9BACT